MNWHMKSKHSLHKHVNDEGKTIYVREPGNPIRVTDGQGLGLQAGQHTTNSDTGTPEPDEDEEGVVVLSNADA